MAWGPPGNRYVGAATDGGGVVGGELPTTGAVRVVGTLSLWTPGAHP
ncbi:hypothetical protein [Micromonospora sp. DH14]|nr:hypothetical protein [Micromonospora sp. DH14]MDG9674162.1 hypothetical protein [Micromonospora sp. DH14]